ncbi:MAG: hypothetical protein IJ859_05855 [Synergistaceae bacterium]|nr:hypothetical protein [Synergistaceae bacterium]
MNFNDIKLSITAEKCGVIVDEQGKIKNFNHNKFLKFYLSKIRVIAYDKIKKAYYIYDDKRHVYCDVDIIEIKQDMLRVLDVVDSDIWNSKRAREIEELLPLRCFSVETLKDGSEYLNVMNGLYSVKDDKLYKHSKEIFTTRQLPFNYNPKAKAPKWKKFLNTVFLGDEQLRLLLQEMTGYALSQKTDAQRFFFLYSDGASGKSIYCKILTKLAGGEKFVSNVTLGDLNKKFARRQLCDAVVNIATENEVKLFNTETIKALTSGDSVQIEGKFERAFSAVITAKQIFALNTLPKPKDITYAFYRRLVIIPFLARFVDEPNPDSDNEFKKNPEILNELEPDLEGILAWAVKGLKRLIKNDYQFTRSDKADELLNEYRMAIDPVLDFMKEAIKADDNSKLNYNVVYNAFKEWCGNSGIKTIKERRPFMSELRYHLTQENIKFKMKHSNSNRFLEGISFKKSFVR